MSEHSEYVSMSMCQSMWEHVRKPVYANMSICPYVSMHEYVSMSIYQSVIQAHEGPLTLRSCLHIECPALTFLDGEVATLGRGCIKALLPIFAHLRLPQATFSVVITQFTNDKQKAVLPSKRALFTSHREPGPGCFSL